VRWVIPGADEKRLAATRIALGAGWRARCVGHLIRRAGSNAGDRQERHEAHGRASGEAPEQLTRNGRAVVTACLVLAAIPWRTRGEASYPGAHAGGGIEATTDLPTLPMPFERAVASNVPRHAGDAAPREASLMARRFHNGGCARGDRSATAAVARRLACIHDRRDKGGVAGIAAAGRLREHGRDEEHQEPCQRGGTSVRHERLLPLLRGWGHCQLVL